MTPLAFARSRPSPVRVRISSRSNSARPPKTVSINRPTALINLATGRRMTYGTLDDRTDRLATHLASLGVISGERVAVLAPNTTDILEVQFACFRLGAIFVPVNVRLTVHELQFILSDASPAVLVHDHEFGEMAHQLQNLCGIAHLLQ